MKEKHNAIGRDIINLRVASSSISHSNSGSIRLTYDIFICTTQTAICAYSSEHINEKKMGTTTQGKEILHDREELLNELDGRGV